MTHETSDHGRRFSTTTASRIPGPERSETEDTSKLARRDLAARRVLSLALNPFRLLFHRRRFVGQLEFRTRRVVLHIVRQVVGTGKV